VTRYVGVDVHKSYLHVGEWVPETGERRHWQVSNRPEGWAELLQRLDGSCHVVLEATGNAFELHDLLQAQVAEVVVANPLELRRLGAGRHTDRVDVDRLVGMLALGVVPKVWVAPQPYRGVRRLLRFRERLVSQRRTLVNQAKAVLRRQGLALPTEGDVRRVLSSREVERLPAEEQVILTCAVQQLAQVEAAIAAVEGAIAQQVGHERGVRRLLTIPGVGLVTAAVIWAALGDPRRFRGPKQVARYAGLDPQVEQSGERDRRGPISRQGKGLLRTVLVEAAQVAARHDTGYLRAFYLRKAKQLGQKRAVVALARKLLIVAWRILCTGRPYRALKPALCRRKLEGLRQRLRRPQPWAELVREVFPPVVPRRARSREIESVPA